MFRRVYYHRTIIPPAPPPLLIVISIVSLINCAASRSIDASDNLTIDRSEVPARYVFEIDEVQDELYDLRKSISPKGEGHPNSDIMFQMPIAVAVFCAVLLLVCCFCCLRCAVNYDGIKRSGTYGRSDKSESAVVEILRRLKPNDEPIKK